MEDEMRDLFPRYLTPFSTNEVSEWHPFVGSIIRCHLHGIQSPTPHCQFEEAISLEHDEKHFPSDAGVRLLDSEVHNKNTFFQLNPFSLVSEELFACVTGMNDSDQRCGPMS